MIYSKKLYSIKNSFASLGSLTVRLCTAAGFMFFVLALFNFNYALAVKPVPAPPEVAAKNYILIDFASGKVLAEREPDVQIEPASITKLMTAYVVYTEIEQGRLSLDDMVDISETAWRKGGSRMFLEVGSSVSVDDLLRGLVVQSGNDASVALAEHIAGTEAVFVQLMNKHAVALGMNNTNFVNSTGWPHENHLTTARDIAILATAIIDKFPEKYPRYAEKEFTFNGIKQYNRNKLLWRDETVDGMKTGHTESAGYCLVTSALRADMRLISVVINTNSKRARTSVSQALLNYGFRFFESHTLYAAGEVLSRPRIWKGKLENLNVGLAEDLAVSIKRGAYNDLDPIMEIDKNIEAPVSHGQQVGVVKVSLDGEVLVTMPLIALETIDRGSFFQVAKDAVLRMVHSFIN